MRYDVIVVGGSFAGLSAAMQLARGRLKVCVIDAGKPRNRFAEQSHGFFGQDGAPPLAMIAQARDKVLAYPNVTFVEGLAKRVSGADGAFELELASGQRVESKKLVLAYGILDRLPEIPGLQERWGKTVLHCPYCHGYEFGGRPLGVLATGPMSGHQAQLIPEWGPTTFFLNGQPEPDAELAQKLASRRVTIERARVLAVAGEATVKLADGRAIELAGLYLGPRAELASDLHTQLGCALDDGPMGPILRTNDRKETTAPGVFAAGDIARLFSNATIASADGVMAAGGVHFSLVFG
ncbi:MAG TPA: NAD(P)/FAD-dependent oxidoreductase [Polyangiales bacterium]|nr:NAD(P)/FAD-dependent oxidoreductase [Polyangiales bacterium]